LFSRRQIVLIWVELVYLGEIKVGIIADVVSIVFWFIAVYSIVRNTKSRVNFALVFFSEREED